MTNNVDIVELTGSVRRIGLGHRAMTTELGR